MLARLDNELAPLHASVNREGNLLRITGPDSRKEPRRRVEDIVAEMGYFAAPVEEYPDVERWFGARETDELSQEEAQVLTERWVAEIAIEGIIDAPDRLAEPLKDALIDAFRSAARTGAVDTVHIGRDRLEQVLSDAETDRVLEWIQRKLI